MIRRPPRSTRVRSSAASDVYKRQALTRLSRSFWLASRSDRRVLIWRPIRICRKRASGRRQPPITPCLFPGASHERRQEGRQSCRRGDDAIGHDERNATTPPHASPEATQASDDFARLRQGGQGGRARGDRSHGLSVAICLLYTSP